jgi:hypothetical protein
MRYGLPYVLEGVRSVKASDEVVRRTAHVCDVEVDLQSPILIR